MRYFCFLFEKHGYAFHTCHIIQEIKIFQTRKSMPATNTESRRNFKTGSAADLHRATRLSYTSGVRVVSR